VEADGQPLFHFTQTLLRGLTFDGGSATSVATGLQRIDSDTTDQRLIQNRLVLSRLPPLRAAASDAELRSDLDAIMGVLSMTGVILPNQLLWIERAAPTAASGVSTSAVIQLDPDLNEMSAKMASFRRHSAGGPTQMDSWVRCEVARLNVAWKGPAERQLCNVHFERFGDRRRSTVTVPSRCNFAD